MAPRLAVAWFVVLLLVPLGGWAASPLVTNVKMRQVPKTRQVEITYDVADADGDSMWVSIDISDDDGATFGHAARNAQGDVGRVATGTGRRVVWDAGTDLGETLGHFRARVTATEDLAVTLPGGATMQFVWIAPGEFIMGSPGDEPGRDPDEGPQHLVTLTRGFYLAKHELTQGQWTAVMGTAPWTGNSYVQVAANNPAVHISWNDAQALVHSLNQAASDSLYRLPTEAEWEYACRGGTTTRWSFGSDEALLGRHAWYSANAWNAAMPWGQPVGTRTPGPWGLFDLHGNVWEWVQDYYGTYTAAAQVDPTGPATGSRRVFRGGSVSDYAQYTRSAYRNTYTADLRRHNVGARLVRRY
jgi:formylglycine-generating enzyme required for sulfatase activity